MDKMRIIDGEMTAAGDICVMGDEPYPDGTPEDVRAWYREHPGEKGLAKAYADAANEFGWLALDVDDFDPGTPEHEAALGTVMKWLKLADELEKVILSIQRRRRDRIPRRGYNPILIRFMVRNGYRDAWGWWVPEPGRG